MRLIRYGREDFKSVGPGPSVGAVGSTPSRSRHASGGVAQRLCTGLSSSGDPPFPRLRKGGRTDRPGLSKLNRSRWHARGELIQPAKSSFWIQPQYGLSMAITSAGGRRVASRSNRARCYSGRHTLSTNTDPGMCEDERIAHRSHTVRGQVSRSSSAREGCGAESGSESETSTAE
jgi:hypothetical protein